jgi:hypothetical protein
VDELTDRELAVAKHAAKLAVEELETRFYAQVGKTLVTKLLVWIGIAVVAYATGKGWISKV